MFLKSLLIHVYIAKRYAKVNIDYLNDYDPKKPSTFISYLDMNNLYGWAMSEYLPYEGFKWLKNIDKFDIMSISDKSPIGYFLEVDLEYPDQLHELHNDFSLAPAVKDVEKFIQTVCYFGKEEESLSETMVRLYKLMKIKTSHPLPPDEKSIHELLTMNFITGQKSIKP